MFLVAALLAMANYQEGLGQLKPTFTLEKGYDVEDNMGMGNVEDMGQAMDRTADNGFIMAGSTRRVVGGPQLLYIAKTDRNGQLEWSREYSWNGIGSSDSGMVYAIRQSYANPAEPDCPGNGYILTGYVSRNSNPDNQIMAFVMKLDVDGTIDWDVFYDRSPSTEFQRSEGRDIRQTSDGGYIITGGTGYALSHTYGCLFPQLAYNYFNGDLFALKLSAGGTRQWDYVFERIPVGSASTPFDHHRYTWGYAVQEIPASAPYDREYVIAGVTHFSRTFQPPPPPDETSAYPCAVQVSERGLLVRIGETENGGFYSATGVWSKEYIPSNLSLNRHNGFYALKYNSASGLLAAGGYLTQLTGTRDTAACMMQVDLNGNIGAPGTWGMVYQGAFSEGIRDIELSGSEYVAVGYTDSRTSGAHAEMAVFEIDAGSGTLNRTLIHGNLNNRSVAFDVAETYDGKRAFGGFLEANNGDLRLVCYDEILCTSCGVEFELSPEEYFPTVYDVPVEEEHLGGAALSMSTDPVTTAMYEWCAECIDINAPAFQKHYNAGQFIHAPDPNDAEDEEWGRDGIQLLDDNFAITGYCLLRGGPNHDQFGLWDSHLMLIKTDENGDQLWNRKFNVISSNGAVRRDAQGFSLAETYDFGFPLQSNGFIVGGDSRDLGQFGTTLNSRMLMMRFNTGGSPMWTRLYGASSTSTYGRAVQNTSGAGNEGHILAGYTTQSYDPLNPTGDNICVVKSDLNGDLVAGPQYWMNLYGGPANDYAHAVLETSNTEYVVAGYSNSFSPGNGDDDIYLIRLNTNGQIVSAPGPVAWSFAYGDPTVNERAFDAELSSVGNQNIVVAGMRQMGSRSDVLVMEVDDDGNHLWTRTYNMSAKDTAHGICAVDGGYVVTGITETQTYGMQGFLLRLNCNGDVEWCRVFPNYNTGIATHNPSAGGQTEVDCAESVIMTRNRDYFVVGTTCSYVSNPGTGGSQKAGGDLLAVRARCDGILCESETTDPARMDLDLPRRTVVTDHVSEPSVAVWEAEEWGSGTRKVLCETGPEEPCEMEETPFNDEWNGGDRGPVESTSDVELSAVAGAAALHVSPVPVKQGRPVMVRYVVHEQTELNLTVVNVLGEVVEAHRLEGASGEGATTLQTAGWTSGRYILHIESNGRTLQTKEVIVVE